MAENHLDYDYLEDEAIDEHFAEDPVGVGMSSVCGERNRLPSRSGFFSGFLCARQLKTMSTLHGGGRA